MENPFVCRADHIYSAWTDISSKSAENVRTGIEAEIITGMRWYSLLTGRKAEVMEKFSMG